MKVFNNMKLNTFIATTILEYLNEQQISEASNISDKMKEVFNTERLYDISFNGRPSKNGWKISIAGKEIEDVYELYEKLHGYLENHNIAHKIATRIRIENSTAEQNRKLFTIYVPDDMDIKNLLLKIEYLLKGYEGWHDIKLPFRGYEVYSGGISFRNDRDDYGSYVPTKDIE